MSLFRSSLYAIGTFAMTASVWAGPAEDLNFAFSNKLVVGRSYLKNFPTLKTKADLVRDYLGTDANGIYLGSGDNFPDLQDGVTGAVQVRNQLGGGGVDSDYTRAKYVAWESLEALMNGQLFAGNSDLLNGLRVAFPATVGGHDSPGTTRPLPLGIPRKPDGAEYAGANLINLGYARLHFLRGISATLDFLVGDPEGRLRAVDRLVYGNAVPNYTAFNYPAYLPVPRFTDTNFAFSGPQGSQTAGYLYGNLVNRFGIANVSIADHLWRAAYFGSPNKPLRGQMLASASAELRRGVHAQFLAALPLAATLPDGYTPDPDGTLPENEYQVARLEQVKSSVASAINLMERINRGESPKLDSLRLNVDDTELQSQITTTASLLNSLESAHTTAKNEIQRLEAAGVAGFQDVISLRNNYRSQMIEICGLDPNNYGGLTTPTNRQAYRDAIQTTFDARMRADLNSPSLVDGSAMGKSAINVLRAFNDIQAANVEMASIPQQIEIEEDRNGDVNTTVIIAGTTRSVVQVAIAVVESTTPKPFVGFPSGLIFDPSPFSASPLRQLENLINIAQEVTINSINSRATIRNLLLRQRELAARMPSVVAQARLAIAEMNGLHKSVLRLVDDYVFFQDGTQQLWYNDPSVVFEQSKAEIEYQQALRAAIIQLYILSQKLGSRWTEDYQNPVRLASGSQYADLDDVGDYVDFTEPESVFTIADHLQAFKMYHALNTWHNRLRTERPSPIGAPNPSQVSLRQDLLGLSDLEWNTNSLSYVPSAARAARNIGIFRAYLLNAQKQNAPKHSFELEFGINYFSPRRSTMTDVFSSPLISSEANNWNHRLTSIKGRVVGANVTQDSKVPFTLYQFGRIYNQGFFDRNDAARVDNLPLYYRDPRTLTAFVPWEGSQQIRLNAGLSGDGAPTDLTGSAITPFCDRYLLTIISSELVAPVNLQNITDILITFTWTVGPPPVFSWSPVP